MNAVTANLAHMVSIEYWTLEDHESGLCRPDEIGRKKPPVREAKRLAQQATPMAIRALIDVATQTTDPSAKVKAAQALLDRGWGKPTETLSIQDGDLTPDQLRELPTESLKIMLLRQLKQNATDITPDAPPSSTS